MKHSAHGDVDQALREQDDGAQRASGGPVKCSICGRRLGRNIICLDETGDVPAPRQSWMLCAGCDTAVRAELQRSPVQGPLRLRIACGLVAAERSPQATRLVRRVLSDDAWLPFLFWGFGAVMIVHIFVLVWIVSLISR
ncbi:MAG TPA: hypothetical protein VGN32_21895 [Ktedonobacterales bacterium]|jgi:hypothetical protein|nr:hypothetical protein [Ktedonobacterales bacterium]